MNESIYTDDIIEMLLQLKTIFRKMGIEYYVVGAAVRDMQIAKR